MEEEKEKEITKDRKEGTKRESLKQERKGEKARMKDKFERTWKKAIGKE